MKKLALLLIPALLAMTACKPETPVTSSSQDQPSSESSSEAPAIPTIDELIDAVLADSFTATVVIKNYDQGQFHDDTIAQLLKDGNKMARRSGESDGGDSYVFEDEFFGVLEGEDLTSYYLKNGYWLATNEYVDEVGAAFEFIDELVDIFEDVKTGLNNDWVYNQERATYYGKSRKGAEIKFDCKLALCPGFFSSINVTIEDTRDGYKQNTFVTISDHNATVVNLPETPISDIADKLNVLGAKGKTLTNFRVDYSYLMEFSEEDEELLVPREETKYEVLTTVYPTATGDETFLVIKRTTAYDCVFYGRLTDYEGKESYYCIRDEGENWETTTSNDFYTGAYNEAFFQEDLGNSDADELAQVIEEIYAIEDNHISFRIININPSTTGLTPDYSIDFTNDDIVTDLHVSFRGEITEEGDPCFANIDMRHTTSCVGTVDFSFPAL